MCHVCRPLETIETYLKTPLKNLKITDEVWSRHERVILHLPSSFFLLKRKGRKMNWCKSLVKRNRLIMHNVTKCTMNRFPFPIGNVSNAQALAYNLLLFFGDMVISSLI
ncbi:hypothetical protein ALC53_08487 [Atta colombica]|uniref:Uncharacterized protein n=1 Tax=Atta colombica TaxID=520822 RepID=A0A195BAC6_9HYME|nr:hypothetical protein ALC53_08487 [Atta colombica]